MNIRLPKKISEEGQFVPKQIIRAINDINDYCLTLRIGESPTVRRRITSVGTILEVDPKVQAGEPSTGLTVDIMRLRLIRPDYLVCNEVLFDPNTQVPFAVSDVDMYVARPWRLRKTGNDGKDIDNAHCDYFTTPSVPLGVNAADIAEGTKRKMTTPSNIVEVQEIIPRYIKNISRDLLVYADLIIAGKGFENINIGVRYNEVAGQNGATVTASGNCEWLDMNNDARAWAESLY